MNYDKLLPTPTSDSAPFWEGLRQGKLVLQCCAACRRVRHYPRPVCDACWSMEADWIEASGNGRVHSWTVTHHAFHPGYKGELPYLLLTVDLEEGVRMNAQANGIDPASVRIGMPVKVGFQPVTDSTTLPVFESA